MATSGSYDFSITRDDLIKDAMLEIGALESGQSPTAEETTDCARRLNMMAKSWMVAGYHLWCVQDAVLFLVPGRQSYALGNASGDAEWADPAEMTETTLSVAAISGAGSITVTSPTGITSGDRVGILLDTGDLQWTTGTVAGSVITLGAVLTSGAVAGAAVFSYTSRLYQPKRVIKDTLYWRDLDANDTPITLIGKTEYDMLTAKTQRGKIVQAAYQPFLSSGRLWTWPTADLATDTLRFSCERPIQDFDLTTDNPDFPIEASKALYLNLAADICGMFGASDELPRLRRGDGSGEAEVALAQWLSFDRDNASVRFQPDLRRSSGSTSRKW